MFIFAWWFGKFLFTAFAGEMMIFGNKVNHLIPSQKKSI